MRLFGIDDFRLMIDDFNHQSSIINLHLEQSSKATDAADPTDSSNAANSAQTAWIEQAAKAERSTQGQQR